MTTVWEPDIDELRASVAEMERWASEEAEDASSKGTKRKRAPPTKGPCEHGVKPPVSVQGVQRLSAREVAQLLQGVRWVSNLRARS